MTAETVVNPKSLIAEMRPRIVARAQSDAAFRDALFTNPRAAVERAFGVVVPFDIKLMPVSQPEDTCVLVLPTPSAALAGAAH